MRKPLNLFARVFAKRKGDAASKRTIAPTDASLVAGQEGGVYGSQSDYADFENPGGYSQEAGVQYPRLPEMPQMVDPEKAESEVAPGDLLDPDPKSIQELLREHGLNEKIVVEFVLGQHKRSGEKRYLLEREWALSLAFDEGRQWIRYDDNTQRLVNMINDDDPTRYITVNLIQMLSRKVASLATMTEPDARAAALTQAPVDKAAAREAAAVLGYCDRKFDRPRQTFEAVLWAIITGTGFRKVVWDGKADALIPKFGKVQEIAPQQPPDDGGMAGGPSAAPPQAPQQSQQPGMPPVVGVEVAPVGDIDESVLPPFEVFLDPAARRWEDVRWLIHAKLQPLTYFQETYPERGFDVEPDTLGGGGGTRSWVDAYVSGGASYAGLAAPSPTQMTTGRTGMGQPKVAVCYELWEMPTPRFPEGRLIVIAGRKLLHYGSWPYAKRDEFPFVPLYYRRASDSPYGIGLVKDAIPLQMAINRLASSMVTQVEMQFDWVPMESGNDVDAQEFLAGVKNVLRRIPYRKGSQPPTVQRSPGISMDRFQLVDWYYQRLQDIFGVHDVSKGSTPAGVTAGISIDLLQQSDQSQLKPFTTEIETSAVSVKGLEISEFEEFASVPRLMGLDESGDPSEALTSVQTFDALTKGGQTRVLVTPGSAMPKTAAGKRQEVLEMYNLGIFGPPGTPDAGRTVVQLLELAGSDIILDALDRIEAKAQMAAQQDQQNQQQLQAQQLQAQQQTQMAQAQMKQQTDIALANQKGQMQAQQDAQTADADVQRQMALAGNQHQLDVAKSAEEARIDVLKEAALQHLGLAQNPAEQAQLQADNQFKIAGLKAKQMASSKPAAGAKATGAPRTVRKK